MSGSDFVNKDETYRIKRKEYKYSHFVLIQVINHYESFDEHSLSYIRNEFHLDYLVVMYSVEDYHNNLMVFEDMQ